MCDPVARRKLGIGRLHAVAVNPAPTGAHQQRPRLADEPDPELGALQHEPRARVKLSRPMADQIAEQHKNFAMRKVADQTQIFPVFHELFAKQREYA